jgi:hypothetical protein
MTLRQGWSAAGLWRLWQHDRRPAGRALAELT